MKIISGWKDYYDHVAHMYGGGDPKVIYNRDYVVPDRIFDGERHEDNLEVNRVWTPNIPFVMAIVHDDLKHVQIHEFNALFVMDRMFILERSGDANDLGSLVHVRKEWHITSRPILNFQMGGPHPLLKNGESLSNKASRYEHHRMNEMMNEPKNDRYRYVQGTKFTSGRDLCLFAKAPVFVVSGNRSASILGRTPKLSALGLPAFIGPEQLYQELAMFVGNVLKPVEQPPSNMQDIEKVVSHGFDKKISFRHRK